MGIILGADIFCADEGVGRWRDEEGRVYIIRFERGIWTGLRKWDGLAGRLKCFQ